MAQVKDLCIDACDAERVGRFWADLLGLEARAHDRRKVVGLWRGDRPVIWVNQVDEAKQLKNRVHLDLVAPSLDPIAELGASVVADHVEWKVMADPEGNEMCIFPPSEPHRSDEPPARILAICVDSPEPEALAQWWAERTGAKVGPGSDGAPRWLHGASGLDGLTWKFVPVHDERHTENRMHWDVVADVAPLVVAGATVVRAPDEDIDWTVLHDPEGNVFCAFPPQ